MSDWKRLLVSHGFGFTRVDSPLTAIIFMDSLPASKRGEMLFEVAYKSCKRATRGETDPAAAFKVFETWARSAELLLPEMEAHVVAGHIAAPLGPQAVS